MLSDLKLFQVVLFHIGSVTIPRMKTKFVAVFLIIGLLSQQAVSGVVSTSMMNSFVSDLSSSAADMSHHQHHAMSSQSGMDGMSNAQMKDCCQSECSYCIVGCYSILVSQPIKEVSVCTHVPSLEILSDPRAQTLESPFRPPIFA